MTVSTSSGQISYLDIGLDFSSSRSKLGIGSSNYTYGGVYAFDADRSTYPHLDP